MAIGPVQILVLGFKNPDFRGEILAEFERLKDNDTVRVIDALAVAKDATGDVAVIKWSDLTGEEASEFGAIVGALIGLGMAGEEGATAGATAGAEASEGGVDVFDESQAWDIVGEIPNDSAAAIIMIEHRWAIPLRNAIWRAGGMGLAEQFIHPLDLVAVGLMAKEEAEALAAGKPAA